MLGGARALLLLHAMLLIAYSSVNDYIARTPVAIHRDDGRDTAPPPRLRWSPSTPCVAAMPHLPSLRPAGCAWMYFCRVALWRSTSRCSTPSLALSSPTLYRMSSSLWSSFTSGSFWQ